MKREKKQIKQKQKIQKRTVVLDNKPTKYLNIWVLIALMIVIGFIAFSKYFTGEYLFFFTDIGSDSINQVFPGIIHKINLYQDAFLSKWSFYKGMGDNHVTLFPSDPYRVVRQAIDFFAIKSFGENYLLYGRFIKLFIYDFLFSAIFTFLYFRTLSIKTFSSIIGALLIAFSAYMVVGSGWGFSSHIFKAIFLLFSFEQLYLKKRWYFFPFAIILLSTNPYVLFIYSVFLFFYFVFRFFLEENNKIIDFVKISGKMMLLGTVGILMNFAQFFQSFMKMYNSPRVAGSSSYSNILSSGQEIAEQGGLFSTTILRFFSSDILGTGSNYHAWGNYLEAPLFYIGLLTLLIFPQVFIHLNKRKKIVFGSFLGFWALTLFVPYLRYAILAFTGDYFRYGFDFFIPFTLLFFAIYSLNQIDKTFKINIKLLAVTIIVLLIALFFPYKLIQSGALNKDLRLIIVIFLFSYSGLIYLLSKPKFKNLAQIGILLVVVFELSYSSYKSYADRVPVTKFEFKKDKGGYADGTIKAVNFIKSTDKSKFYRIEKDYQSGNAIHGSLNDAKAQGYYGTTSYSSFNQLNYVRFLEETGLIQKGDETATRWIAGFRGYPLLQTFGNVKYHLSKSQKPEFLKFGFDSLSRKNGVTILKNRFYLPFGYTYDKYIYAKDFKNLFEYSISAQSLNLISQELSLIIKFDEVGSIITNLKPLLNKKYKTEQAFVNDISKATGINDKKIIRAIKKHSIQTFKNQIALLNAFVYEEDKSIDIKPFQKLDTLQLKAEAAMFNFEIYKNLTDSLRQDTLQITSFKQSKITGNINLTKTKMLFFTIPYDDGWKIRVNGKDEALSRVSFGFTGIVLPQGTYNIELYYVPKFSQLTNTISIISILGFWIFLVFYFIKRKQSK